MKGYKHTELGWIPEDWEVTRLGNLVKLISGLHLIPDEYNRNELGIPYFTGPSDYTNSSKELTKWTKKSVAVAKEDDILITVKGSGVGSMHYLKLPEVAIGRQVMAIRDFDTPSFIYQYLLQKEYQFQELAKGNMIPGLSRDDILTIKIKRPTVPERKKIAAILSTWDKSIETLTQLIGAKQQLKKGLMQQLLSGKKRLPGFKNKWEKLKLGEVIEKISNGATYDSKIKTGEVPITRIETIANWTIDFDRVGYAVPFADQKNYQLKSGDILFSHINSLAHIGKVAIYNDSRPLYHGMNLLLIRSNKDRVFPNYLYEVLSSDDAQQHFKTYAKKAINQASLNASDVKELVFELPHIEEQKAISKVLSLYNKEILLLEKELSAYKEQKQGLMQQLLTGKKRVKV